MNKQGQILVPKLTLTMMANKINQRLQSYIFDVSLEPTIHHKPVKKQAKTLQLNTYFHFIFFLKTILLFYGSHFTGFRLKIKKYPKAGPMGFEPMTFSLEG
jgi:hypothetical protein